MRKKVELWIDLRSPFSFLAKDPAYDLERDFDAELRVRPFALNIAGAVNLSDPEAIARGMRKIKYFYLDARRFANQRGITLLGPKKIFDQTLVHLAWLYADKTGHGRALIDLAFPRFFKREIDYENRDAIVGLLQDAGVDPAGFDGYAAGEGPDELKRHQADAEQQGVFAVPTFVVDGELFWGPGPHRFRARQAGGVIDVAAPIAQGPRP